MKLQITTTCGCYDYTEMYDLKDFLSLQRHFIEEEHRLHKNYTDYICEIINPNFSRTVYIL
jgi:hypothetical protein